MSAYMGGRALREARIAAGLTMRDAETRTIEEFGVDGAVLQPTITRYEKGQIGRPDVGILAKLCIVYKVPLDNIVEAYGYPTRKVVPEVDERLRNIERLASAMPPEARSYYYEQLDHAANMALINILQKFPGSRQEQYQEEYRSSRQKRDSDRPLTAAV